MTISTEQFIVVNVGTSANDGSGDSLRAAFIKVNENFNIIENMGFGAANIAVSNSIEVSGTATLQGNVTISNVYVPATTSSAGTTGQLTWDSTYMYVCVATNQWKRANLAAW